MESTGSSTLTNVLIAASLGSTALSMPIAENWPYIPTSKSEISAHGLSFEGNDNVYEGHLEYRLVWEDSDKLQTIFNFSNKIIENTSDMDQEFLDIVNDNFWDLI